MYLKKETNLIQKINEIVLSINDQRELEKVCGTILAHFKGIQVLQQNPIILQQITNNLITKYISMESKGSLTESVRELFEFLMGNGLVCQVFKSEMSRILQQEDSLREGGQIREQISSPQNSVINSELDQILNINCRAEKYINKTFGYSLLDLSGDFLWCDGNSSQFFELVQNDLSGDNLFDLMTPVSKRALIKRLKLDPNQNQIFQNSQEIGQSVTMSYIVYSKKNQQKYIKQLKKNKIDSLENVLESQEHRGKSLFYKYLKALSSKATIVLLKFSKPELQNILKNESLQFSSVGSLKEMIEKEDGREVIYRKALLLETRLAKEIPDIDFSQMKRDPVIQEFESYVAKKIKKFNQKSG